MSNRPPITDETVDDLLTELGESIEMDGRFKADLRERLRRRQQVEGVRPTARRSVQPAARRRSMGWVVNGAVAAVLFVLLAFVVLGPLRYAGQPEPLYFEPIPQSDYREDLPQPERAVVRGRALWRNLTAEELRLAAGFDLRLPVLPEGWRFAGARISEQGSSIRTNYLSNTMQLSLTQQRGDEVERLPIREGASVTRVRINGMPGEYIEGTWASTTNTSDYTGDRLPETVQDLLQAESSFVWEEDSAVRTLRWEAEGSVYTMYISGEGQLDRGEMVAFAENLMGVRPPIESPGLAGAASGPQVIVFYTPPPDFGEVQCPVCADSLPELLALEEEISADVLFLDQRDETVIAVAANYRLPLDANSLTILLLNAEGQPVGVFGSNLNALRDALPE